MFLIISSMKSTVYTVLSIIVAPCTVLAKFQTLIMSLPDFLTKEVEEDTVEFGQDEEPESTRKVVPVSGENKEMFAGTAVAGVGAAGAAVAAGTAASASDQLPGAEQQSLFTEETDLVSDSRKKEEVPEPEIKPVVIPVADKPDVSGPVIVTAGAETAGERPDMAAAGTAVTKPVISVAEGREDVKPAGSEGESIPRKPKKKSGFLGKLLAVILLLFLLAAGGIYYFFSSSKPDIVVPDVNGKPVAEAQKTLEAQGFKVELENKVDPSVKPGMVLRMDPVAGIRRKEGATVTLIVSGTEKMVAVPKIVGLKQDQAEKLLSDKIGRASCRERVSVGV